MIVEHAAAKVNLRLRVLERRADGYHELETIFCALELADRLEVEPAAELRLDVRGAELGDARENLVWRAARAFYEAADSKGAARFRLEKRIPHGAGLGGGSSDAAAALRALNALHGGALEPAALHALATRLGSDVPFFLSGSPLALARGRGEELAPLAPLPRAHVLLAVPPFRSATTNAYAALDAARSTTHSQPPRTPITQLVSWADVALLAVNDFEDVILAAHPELARIKAHMLEHGAALALLAGSGSAIFGVFETQDALRAAATRLKVEHASLQYVETRTLTTHNSQHTTRDSPRR